MTQWLISESFYQISHNQWKLFALLLYNPSFLYNNNDNKKQQTGTQSNACIGCGLEVAVDILTVLYYNPAELCCNWNCTLWYIENMYRIIVSISSCFNQFQSTNNGNAFQRKKLDWFEWDVQCDVNRNISMWCYQFSFKHFFLLWFNDYNLYTFWQSRKQSIKNNLCTS